ncbi:MAG TPA: glucokinase [Tepidisphaeraceae bacterium]|nr:glucokinase [Tepidisphaeraceae bacterium]
MILAGDIGGTNTRLAIFQDDGATLVRQHVFKNAGRTSFLDIAREFLSQHQQQGSNQRITKAAFGVAGAVRGGVVKMTNLGWTLIDPELERDLDIPNVALINDMVAHGENIANLRGDQLVTLRAGERCADGGGAVIIAGTGLGEGGLYYDRATKRLRGLPSEGGHCDFAPRDQREQRLLECLRDRGKPPTWESVVSGPGLRVIYDFLRAQGGDLQGANFGKDGPRPEQITDAAAAGACPLCVETTHLFVSLYGAEAGNLALKFCATAGVWLGGSIAESLLDLFRGDVFLNSFSQKGPPRIREMLGKVPIHLIKFELNGLYGAASYAASL